MASNKPASGPVKAQQQPNSKKRKDPPTQANRGVSDKKPKFDHRAKQRDARQISAQATGKAFRNGELDVDQFVKAREYEIRALEDGMQRSKKALNRRAFQQVPKELRRRTASHNVKRVPKRLRERGKREMVEDNTPTVTSRRRKPTRHMRLRLETAKKLRALEAKRKMDSEKVQAEKITVIDPSATADVAKDRDDATSNRNASIKTRTPRVKKSMLAKPPAPKAKFRKRQIHKSWLPTHLFHAKRARMTPPSAPLWRFSIPMTPTAKCYRPTHRASHQRGAVAWDTSYMSTLSLEGREDSIIGMLKAMGVREDELTTKKGEKWRRGTRVLEAEAYEREHPYDLIAPVAIIWCVPALNDACEVAIEPRKQNRKAFIRVHPSAFFQLWIEVLRLAKVAKPEVSVEDLRFELGSIQITGPGATEALLGALWPSRAEGAQKPLYGPVSESVEKVWTSLAGLTNPAMLPRNALLAFDIQDPRLHHPPRTVALTVGDGGQHELLSVIAEWPVDSLQTSPRLFERKARLEASRASPSQKAINRRKTLAPPGQYPSPSMGDPKVPLLLHVSSVLHATSNASNAQFTQASWSLMLPWKCIQPVWYSLMYYPLSTGQQPRFGGLDEVRQLAFEAGRPWFPADFAGTQAGWEWELLEREKRRDEWKRRPKGKRASWEKVELGGGKKGEVGAGWACDWERLLEGPPKQQLIDSEILPDADAQDADHQNATSAVEAVHGEAQAPPSKRPKWTHLSAAQALARLANPGRAQKALPPSLFTVRLSLMTRGVPQACARIYRIPSSAEPESASLRKQWLALLPAKQTHHKHRRPRKTPPSLPKNAPPHEVQQRLAQSLLNPAQAGDNEYPSCPGEEDLIGFVTTGNFNLAEGQGTGIGCLLLERLTDGVSGSEDEKRLCILRNSGMATGRLAQWHVA